MLNAYFWQNIVIQLHTTKLTYEQIRNIGFQRIPKYTAKLYNKSLLPSGNVNGIKGHLKIHKARHCPNDVWKFCVCNDTFPSIT
jgi:hypothetical protein